jgi:tetratricopeptide (TPR) repeat protein
MVFRWDPSQRWVRQARQALDQSRYAEAQQYAYRLEADGQIDQARLLRGQICLQQGRDLLAQRRLLLSNDRMKQSAEAVAVTARAVACPWGLASAVVVHDPLLWPPMTALGPFAEQRRAVTERAEAALTQAVREFGEIPEESELADQATPGLAEAVALLRDLGRAAPLTDLIERLRKFVERHPDHVEAHRRLAQFYIDLNALSPALSELQQVARLDPDDGRPWRVMGLIYRDTLREGSAIDAYRQALQRRLEPHVAAEVREELAQLLLDQGFPQEALEVLQQAPTWLRKAPPCRTIEAAALWAVHRKSEARRLVEAALAEDPHHVPALRLVGKMFLDEDEPRQAIAYLRQALELRPHDEKARHMLADAYRAAGDPAAAEAEQKKFAETVGLLREVARLGRIAHNQPWNVEVRLENARILAYLGRLGEARNWVRSALAADPDSAEARKLLRELGPPGD